MSNPFLRGRLAKAYRRFVRHVNRERRARGREQPRASAHVQRDMTEHLAARATSDAIRA
ncbi:MULTISPECIES: hypothetical protein [Sorangium]|uniref:hypothetical protein n=1 Tax=Sorangium TaxID=39643 RepID=UPI0013EB96AC|nr:MULTISPECIES: hypothetical protein [Sorangium]